METHRLALIPGFRLENFQIERILGKGGFGITYVALDLHLGKRVAIKELLPDSIATRVEGSTVVPQTASMQESWEWARARFLEEAQILANFSHPAIVGVHRLIEANGTVYMVMDFIDGESYEARLRRIGKEASQEVLMEIIAPILDGLREVHSKNLLHRDIKPENILLSSTGQPVLIDFGSARTSIGATMSMTSIVTHGYSPIEQYQTKGRMGPWTDIYALGAVMCRAITGEKPPVAADRLMADDFEWLSYRKTLGYNEGFLLAVDWSLRIRPEERPQSVMQMTEALKKQQAVATKDDHLETSDLPASVIWREAIRSPATAAPADIPIVKRLTMLAAGLGLLGLLVLFVIFKSNPRDQQIYKNPTKQDQTQIEQSTQDKSLEIIIKAAESGENIAQFKLANIYHKGTDIKKDDAAAAHWYRKAAEQGNIEAQNKLGWMLDEGRGVDRNDSEAVRWYEEAARANFAPAKYNFAMMLRNGEGIKKDLERAKKLIDAFTKSEIQEIFYWYKELAECGDPSAQMHLAGMYEDGKGFPKDDVSKRHWMSEARRGFAILAEAGDVEAMTRLASCLLDDNNAVEAIKWLRRAADKDCTQAKYMLGRCFYLGKGVEKNLIDAAYWYRNAAEQGDAAAQVKLGLLYYTGEGVEKNFTDSVKWFRKSAEQGTASAQQKLGVCYYKGEGVEINYAEAVKWFHKSAEQGYTSALDWLGLCYYNGYGVEKNLTEAVKFYHASAEKGSVDAQTNLGKCYALGEGVEKNLVEAARWYFKAAEQGSATAQNELGECYALGNGVEKNPAEAIKWYLKAAGQSYAIAQTNLGKCYALGEGVEENPAEAVKWYRRAAEQDESAAQNYLGVCYSDGKGVKKNLAEAVKWYRKAAANGNVDAKTNLQAVQTLSKFKWEAANPGKKFPKNIGETFLNSKTGEVMLIVE